MFKKLDDVENKFEQVQQRLQDPQIASDQNEYCKLMKELASLQPVVETYRDFKKVTSDLESNRELVATESDEELRSLAKEEIRELEARMEELTQNLKILLLPKDPFDDKDIILEIRPAAGGDESALFAEELFRAYFHYASQHSWRVEVLNLTAGNVGGVKEVIAGITGDNVYSRLKFESGVHRVQRVPKTESQGRVHTSTVTVAVLPEADDVEVQVDPNDLRIDVYRSSGHGGQSVNTTDSAVRITHIPTGLVVSCQDEKSQLKNKNKAMKVLKARLLAIEEQKARQEASDARLSQIGTGDRSERIRTYNFPQSRITDHRIGLTTHNLSSVMAGEFDILIEPLVAHYQAEALKEQGSMDAT